MALFPEGPSIQLVGGFIIRDYHLTVRVFRSLSQKSGVIVPGDLEESVSATQKGFRHLLVKHRKRLQEPRKVGLPRDKT